MTNSKTFVWVIFIIWSALCWRWYVCGIKQACNKKAEAPTETGIVAVPVAPQTRNDTASRTVKMPNSTVPVTKQAPAPPPVKNKEKDPGFNASKIDKIQMEAVSDKILIHFPYNSIKKEDDSVINSYLTNLATELVASGKKVTVTGHTDFVGDAKSNNEFGLRRANSIRDLLIKKGVHKNQIICKSMGDRKPMATNDTANGRYQNRRVEIQIVK
jgi:outer membrane protein OmpA-like peptidoglycan-associated protein